MQQITSIKQGQHIVWNDGERTHYYVTRESGRKFIFVNIETGNILYHEVDEKSALASLNFEKCRVVSFEEVLESLAAKRVPEPSMPAYKVIAAKTSGDLSILVSDALKEGYMLHGELQFLGGCSFPWIQAVSGK